MFHDELDNIRYDKEFRTGYLRTYIVLNIDILSRVSDRRRLIGLSNGFITHKQLHTITMYTLYDY
jgi:hypothetical protein